MDFERVSGLHDGDRERGLQAIRRYESGKDCLASAQGALKRRTILIVKIVAEALARLIRGFDEVPSPANLERDHAGESQMR
jgi:hypothetical protein